MTIRLRPHHLLCLLTYAGKGYGPAFTANYDAIAGRISQGEDILIVEGPDDICAPLLDDREPHCWRDSVTERDRLAARDLGRLLLVSIQDGRRIILNRHLLERMREAFSAGDTRSACEGCEWHDLCSTIAAGGYCGIAIPRER
ncbi:DUF1284 domain-containing protein [Chelativorans xinjiangense]|uniref:DUF1284 domain-containing protein n=1 Tax=Chelativorans xinjiangense TaxID=2681485 RepID=UPI00135AE4C5|nr:DUF1284 domain-containing protein [Chelativorans xinjiangense]